MAFVHLSWFNYAGEIIRIGLFFSEIFRFILIFCMYSGVEIGLYVICDTFCNLVPVIQCKMRGKHPWRSVTFAKLQF